MTLNDVKDIIKNGEIGYFATTNGDRLEVRGWQYQFEKDNKFYFVTNNTKDVFRQMQINPQIAFACVSNGHNVRISGKAAFVTEQTEKEEAFKKLSPGVREIYKNGSNPVLEVFYISSGEIKVNKGKEPFEVVKF